MKKVGNYIKKYLTMKENRKKVISISTLLIVAIIAIIVIPKAFSNVQPIEKVTINSEENLNYQDMEPGSWQVRKSAKWISYGKARITFEVNSVLKMDKAEADILLVLDTSGTMRDKKLTQMKEDTTDLINKILKHDSQQVGLIIFNDDATILSDFTRDGNKLIDEINNLRENGETNYYKALKKVDEVLKDYTPTEEKGCIVLFLTDGIPSIDSPNEVNLYHVLKNKYPYMTVHGVQYDMGDSIKPALANICEAPLAADIGNLNYSLSNAAMTRRYYTNFSITDYINNEYFEIESEKDIDPYSGKVSLTEENGAQKVYWNMGRFGTGLKTHMTIDVTLKEKYLGQEGLYPTNLKEIINTSLDGVEEDVESELTPILQGFYPVKYDGNAPAGCTVTGIPEQENHMVFETVGLSATIPKCNGYQFKGWKIITTNVKKINDDYFTMPANDVLIRAEWSKVTVEKTMDGQVFSGKELYNIIAKKGQLDTNVDFTSSNLTAGVYEYSPTKENEYPVYYYRGPVTNNNVIFSNQCWKIVRTTDTGGVKLVYNGKPGSDGSCKNTGTASEVMKNGYNYNNGSDRKDVNNAFLGYLTGSGSDEAGYKNNTWKSLIMLQIDSWYSSNISAANRNRLEDTVYCNDRRLVSGGEWITTPAVFEGHNRALEKRVDLTCADTDSLTVSKDVGNGALSFPTALLTLDELILAGLGEDSYLNTGETWWTMTVDSLVDSWHAFVIIASNGMVDKGKTSDSHGVRPAVSLKPHIVVWDGDGSEEDPYIIP